MGLTSGNFTKVADGYHYLNETEVEASRIQVNFVISQELDFSKTSKEKNKILNDIRRHEKKLVLEEIKSGKIKI